MTAPQTRGANGVRQNRLTSSMKVVIGGVAVVIIAGLVIALTLWNTDPQSGSSGSPAASGQAMPSPTQTPGPAPGATPTTGSEVPPPPATPNTGLPPLDTAAPLLSSPLPDSASASGALVKGFPTGIITLVPESEILTSAIATEEDQMQVSLSAVTSAEEEEVREYYRRFWSGLGLQERTSEGDQVLYSGAYESLNLAIEATGTGVRYAIHGTFRTK